MALQYSFEIITVQFALSRDFFGSNLQKLNTVIPYYCWVLLYCTLYSSSLRWNIALRVKRKRETNETLLLYDVFIWLISVTLKFKNQRFCRHLLSCYLDGQLTLLSTGKQIEKWLRKIFAIFSSPIVSFFNHFFLLHPSDHVKKCALSYKVKK